MVFLWDMFKELKTQFKTAKLGSMFMDFFFSPLLSDSLMRSQLGFLSLCAIFFFTCFVTGTQRLPKPPSLPFSLTRTPSQQPVALSCQDHSPLVLSCSGSSCYCGYSRQQSVLSQGLKAEGDVGSQGQPPGMKLIFDRKIIFVV